MGLVSATYGTNTAQYAYGPFGELIRATGPMAKLNPFRFSTKYQDDETDLVYYGRRYLNTSTGRWINRDPIAEKGGLNLYGFVRNNAVNYIDKLGLEPGRTSPDPDHSGSGITCKKSISFELVPKEEFNNWHEKMWSWGSTFVSNSDDMLKQLDKLVPRYDPDGICCKGSCINHLSISAHGEFQQVVLSTDETESYSLIDEKIIQSNLNKGQGLSDPLKNDQMRNQKALDVLRKMAGKLCRNAKVSIVQCKSEDEKNSLKTALQEIFGSGIEVETFDSNCGLYWGEPKGQ